MRLLNAFIIGIILFPCSAIAQNRWEITHGLPNKRESLRDIIEQYDKGYFIAATEMNDRYSWELKTDINGELLWDKKIGNINNMFTPTAVINNYDGGIIIIGGYWENSDVNGGMVIKLDSCGEKVWCNYYETAGLYTANFWDVLLLNDSNIIVLCYLGLEEQIEQIFLFCYSQEGDLLWIKPYATKYNHPEIDFATGRDLYRFNNYYFISGFCYWYYPGNPNIAYLHPLIIKVDSAFNEEWLLPYGVNDSINGFAWGILQLSGNEYMAYGDCMMDGDSGVDNRALIIQFNEQGNETGYSVIPNEAIDPPTHYNLIQEAVRITDSTFIAAANFGPEYEGNPNGEYIFDLSGNIYQYNSRENTFGLSKVIKTSDNNYLFGTKIKEGSNYDILLYKLNENLESVPIDTNQYTYDSLCPYQIQSGTISIEDCEVITDISNFPTPEEYYAKLKTIPIKAYPNPAKDNITFGFENTKYHQNMQLQCFDIFGRIIHKEKIYTGQLETEINVSQWNEGLYVAVIKSNGKVLGKVKCVVLK
jgi:hypothetical protein